MEKEIDLFVNILKLAMPEKPEEYFDDIRRLMLSKSGKKREAQSLDVTEFLYPYL